MRKRTLNKTIAIYGIVLFYRRQLRVYV